MIPKKIYLNKQELHDAITCERMVSCNEPYRDMTEEYVNISQVWHDASEEPKEDMDILCIYKNMKVHKVSKIDNQLYDWLNDNNSIDKWAYISDLLPK